MRACARVAPGLRRLAADSLPIKTQADRFGGLPEGASIGQVLAAFKRVAVPLGLGAVRDLVDQLYAYSQAQDWQRGSRPLSGRATPCSRSDSASPNGTSGASSPG